MNMDKPASFEDFIKTDEVKNIIKDKNRELIARINHPINRCAVFENDYTIIDEDPSVKFDIHPEAKKQLPDIIENRLQIIKGGDITDESQKKEFFRKKNIGIVFSGGPAPGGHNIIGGLFDAAKKANPETKIFGFLKGPDGIIENDYIEITASLVDAYRNLGGFTMIKTGRTKVDTKEKIRLSRKTCKKLNLNALVIVGGDDSNTNAALLAQELLSDGIQVLGVPKTIDGDVQVRDANGNVLCAMSFGFHTAARGYANSINNLSTDCSSDVKYWHVCKVMGRSASHLALEVGLQTHANITLIGEDLAEYTDIKRMKKAEQKGEIDHNAFGMTLRHLSRVVCDAIVRRAENGKNYGLLIIPEGVLEFINEIQTFIIKLNTIIAEYNDSHDNDFHSDFPALEDKQKYLRRIARIAREEGVFSVWNTRDDDLFAEIPPFFQEGLLLERDSHGNFSFSLVETDKVIIGLVNDYLNLLKERGEYRLGINKDYYTKLLSNDGLDPDFYGRILFNNYDDGEYLLRRKSIVSRKTLGKAMKKAGAIGNDDPIPLTIEKIYKKSIPNFKTQNHFYGYDGRGGDPTYFDCTYTYNLGLTVFSLIANKATGQMAAIKNLDADFDEWTPIGIPIAPLMHLEERKGKLDLVIEKSIVDVKSTAFKVLKALREKWLAATPGNEHYRRPGPIAFTGDAEEDRPITLMLNHLGKMMER